MSSFGSSALSKLLVLAKRVYMRHTSLELRNYIGDSKLVASLLGVQVAMNTTFWSSLVMCALVLQVPFSIPEFYRKEVMREEELIREGHVQPASDLVQQTRILARLVLPSVAGAIFVSAMGVAVLLPVTVPAGTLCGLVVRALVRRRFPLFFG